MEKVASRWMANMASAVLALRTRAAALLSASQSAALEVRYASKKTGGSSKNLGGKSPGQHYGLRKMEGQYVHAGNVLASQRHLCWHPGAHVGLGKRKYLYALEESTVCFTKEVYVPNPQNTDTVDLVIRLLKGAVLYKTFIHVVPAGPRALSNWSLYFELPKMVFEPTASGEQEKVDWDTSGLGANKVS